MVVYPHKVLHITIDGEGQISCWDNRDRALLGKQDGEEYVALVLTLLQTDKLKQAMKEARRKKKE